MVTLFHKGADQQVSNHLRRFVDTLIPIVSEMSITISDLEGLEVFLIRKGLKNMNQSAEDFVSRLELKEELGAKFLAYLQKFSDGALHPAVYLNSFLHSCLSTKYAVYPNEDPVGIWTARYVKYRRFNSEIVKRKGRAEFWFSSTYTCAYRIRRD